MKKNFPILLLRIGGFVALLSVAAFILMMVVKLLVTTLLLVGIGGLIFKMVAKKRPQMMVNDPFLLTIESKASYTNSKIQPIYKNTNSNKTIIPIL